MMAYKNFKAALFFTVNTLMSYDDPEMLKVEEDLTKIRKYVHIDKVYLETYRSGILADREHILKVKEFFKNKGFITSGAITPNPARKVEEKWNFAGFCYSNENQVEELKNSTVGK